MRRQAEDNAKLVWILGQYMGGEEAMPTINNRHRLWIARELLGIESRECLWIKREHWKGQCLAAGIDPKTFRVVDWELFNAAWARFERIRREKKAGKVLGNQIGEPDMEPAVVSPEAVFRLPRF
jgi:hypothetical protein